MLQDTCRSLKQYGDTCQKKKEKRSRSNFLINKKMKNEKSKITLTKVTFTRTGHGLKAGNYKEMSKANKKQKKHCNETRINVNKQTH